LSCGGLTPRVERRVLAREPKRAWQRCRGPRGAQSCRVRKRGAVRVPIRASTGRTCALRLPGHGRGRLLPASRRARPLLPPPTASKNRAASCSRSCRDASKGGFSSSMWRRARSARGLHPHRRRRADQQPRRARPARSPSSTANSRSAANPTAASARSSGCSRPRSPAVYSGARSSPTSATSLAPTSEAIPSPPDLTSRGT
jgi:hypothetical protein